MSPQPEEMDYDMDNTIILYENLIINDNIYDNINNLIYNLNNIINIQDNVEDQDNIEEPIEEPATIQQLTPYLLYNTNYRHFNINNNINTNLDFNTIHTNYDIRLTDIQYNNIIEFLNAIY